MEKIGDPGLREFVLRAPKESIERANVDTNAAEHTKRKVDVESIDGIDLARLAAGTTRRRLLLVPLDVNAPIRALASTQHARSAVLFVKGNHATCPCRRRFLLVRVLHGLRALDGVGDRLLPPIGEDGAKHCAASDAEAFDESWYESHVMS